MPSVKRMYMLRSAALYHIMVYYKHARTPGMSGDAAKGIILRGALKYINVCVCVCTCIYTAGLFATS
jgi:hypothetical protein